MKKSSKLFCGLLGASLALSMGLTLATASPITSSAEGIMFASEPASLSVKLFDKENREITTSRKTVIVGADTYGLYQADWKDVAYVSVSLPSSMTIVSSNEFELSLKWIPEETSGSTVDFEVDRLCSGSVLKKTFSTAEELDNSYKVYIDMLGGDNDYKAGNIIKDKDNSTKTYLDNGGWGIYQFELVVNTIKYNSDLVEIKPTDLSTIASEQSIQIEKTAVRSQYLIDNAYQISFKDKSNPFNYVKRNLIQWHVEGEGSDGQKYVLLPSHRPDDKTKSLLTDESVDYTGTSMKFDFNLTGTWKVYCVVTDNSGDEEVRWVSNAVDFSTVKVISSSYIIWIIVAAVVVAAVILTVIIVVSKKKEKTW